MIDGIRVFEVFASCGVKVGVGNDLDADGIGIVESVKDNRLGQSDIVFKAFEDDLIRNVLGKKIVDGLSWLVAESWRRHGKNN